MEEIVESQTCAKWTVIRVRAEISASSKPSTSRNWSSKLKRICRGLWSDEIRKAKWGELKLENVLTEPVSLKKAAKLVEESELIGYLRAQIENDE